MCGNAGRPYSSHRQARSSHIVKEVKRKLPFIAGAHPAGVNNDVIAALVRSQPEGLHLLEELRRIPMPPSLFVEYGIKNVDGRRATASSEQFIAQESPSGPLLVYTASAGIAAAAKVPAILGDLDALRKS